MDFVLTACAGTTLDKVFHGFDTAVFDALGSTANSALTAFFKAVTFLGDAKFILLLLCVSAILLAFKKTRRIGLAVIISLVLSTLIVNIILKPTVMRTRPFITLADNSVFSARYKSIGSPFETDYSFPSGHTAAAFSYSTALFICLRKQKIKAAYILPFAAVLVMMSRVYLMVHYASDVVFGAVFGIASGIIGFFAACAAEKLLAKISLRKNGTAHSGYVFDRKNH